MSAALREIRVSVLSATRVPGYRGHGETLHLDLSCGHRKMVSRPPAVTPKTTVCFACSRQYAEPAIKLASALTGTKST